MGRYNDRKKKGEKDEEGLGGNDNVMEREIKKGLEDERKRKRGRMYSKKEDGVLKDGYVMEGEGRKGGKVKKRKKKERYR